MIENRVPKRPLAFSAAAAAVLAGAFAFSGIVTGPNASAASNGQNLRLCTTDSLNTVYVEGSNQDGVTTQVEASLDELKADGKLDNGDDCYLMPDNWWKGNVTIDWIYSQGGVGATRRTICQVPQTSTTDATICSDRESDSPPASTPKSPPKSPPSEPVPS